MLTLTRFYMPQATVGYLDTGSFDCWTMEPAWSENAVGESCIPEGLYALGMRESPKVSSITKGKHKEGWEVQDVANRSFIMLHPGNWARNSDGCILTGRDFIIHNNEPMVTHSQDTFDGLMDALGNAGKEHTLLVRAYSTQLGDKPPWY